MTDQNVELQIRAKNLTKDAFDAVQAALKALEESSNNVTKKGKSNWAEWFATIASGTAVGNLISQSFTAAAGVLSQIPQQLIELGSRGADVSDLQDHFARLNEEIGENAPEALDKMRSAMGGTMSDYDLMKDANEALSHGLKLTGDDFSVLAQTARISADAVGGDAKQQYESLLQSISQGREKGLKGLPLDFAAVTKSVQDHAAALGTDVAHLSEHEHALALRNAVLEQGKKLIKDAGAVENDFADNVARGKAMLDNMRDSLALAIAKSPALNALFKGVEYGIDHAFGTNKADQVKAITGYVDKFALGMVTAADYGVTAADALGGGFLGLELIWNTLLGDFGTFEAGIDAGLIRMLNIMRDLPGQNAQSIATLDNSINQLADDEISAAAAASHFKHAADENRGSMASWSITMDGAHGKLKDLHASMEKAIADHKDDVDAKKKNIATTKDWGAAVTGGNDAAIKAATAVRELTSQIEAAQARGLSASQILELFGKKALQASDDARRAGAKSSTAIEEIATSAMELAGAWDNAASSQKMWQALQENPASKNALAAEQDNIDLVVQMAQVDQDRTIAFATGTRKRLLEIEKERQGQIDALNKMSTASADFKRERMAQIDAVAQHEIDVATGSYSTIVERMQAAGIATRRDLQITAIEADRDYKQMAASGQFSADALRAAWEDSLHKQAAAMGGFKGDLLNMYAGLADQLAGPLADMLTHWHKWRDDLKSLWGSIEGDFASVIASMVKRWIEGLLMKLLDSVTGSRGAFASAWAAVMPGAGGGAGLGGFGGTGGGLGQNISMVRQIGGLFGVGGGAAVGGVGLEAGIPMFGATSGLGSNVTNAAMQSDPALAGATPGTGGATTLGILGGGLMAAQGLYSMFKAQTRTQNVIGGAETGAGIGTMILPGIGTAIGAGFGALAGLIKSFFGVSQQEKQGRGVVADFQQQTVGGLSDAQKTEANQAVKSGVWTDPQAAGMLIAVRDAYLSMGKTAQQAQDDVKTFWDAEKQGPEATTAAMQPLQQALDAFKQKQDAAGASTDSMATKMDGLISAMKPDEFKALSEGFQQAIGEGFTGTIEDFTQQQLKFYQTLDEGDARLKTWFSGDTISAFQQVVDGTAASVDTLTGSMDGLIAQMKPDEFKALSEGYHQALTEGFTGSLQDFTRQQAEFYNTLKEGDARAKTWFSGDTITAFNKIAGAGGDAAKQILADYTKMGDGVRSSLASVNKSLDDLNNSEKPEAVMGSIEKAQRASLDKQKADLEEQLRAIEAASAAAVQAVATQGTTAATTLSTTIGTQISKFPETFGRAGIDAAIRFKSAFLDMDIPPVHIPSVVDPPETQDGGGDGTPIPGHARGGLFTRAHIARIAEAGRPEIIGDQDFMTHALTGAVQKVGGVVAGGGSSDPQALFQVLHDAFVAALHTTGLSSLGTSPGQRDAADRFLPTYIPDMLSRFGSARRQTQNAMGVTG